MMLRLLQPFAQDYSKLPHSVQRKVDRQLARLKENLSHPGLNARKVAGRDVWEARIDYHYRVTFIIKGDVLVMRRVGTHAIYRKP